MTRSHLLEVCVDSADSAVAAQQGGANRVELCANLVEGGCTPSPGVIQATRRRLDTSLHVIIRPRGGDFCYSDAEFETMGLDIAFAKQAGADGIVIGLLTEDGAVDTERARALVEAARPMSVTFHRAFDVTREPFQALDTLITLGVDRILTSGQEGTALDGLDLIHDLIQRAADRIVIMPGGGIKEHNFPEVLARSGATEFHVRLPKTFESPVKYRNPRVAMGATRLPPEYTLSTTDPDRVRAMVEMLGGGRNCTPGGST